jgi:hypothetical protein
MDINFVTRSGKKRINIWTVLVTLDDLMRISITPDTKVAVDDCASQVTCVLVDERKIRATSPSLPVSVENHKACIACDCL